MSSARETTPDSRLTRRLGTGDAVVMGLGSMIGAGVFTVFGPAAAAAGTGLLVALALAAAVALCNATSSAQLAALYPESGGAYVYGRRRLGPFWGYLAGWSFVVGKLASCAAMALTFGYYVAPDFARELAVAAVIGLVTVNIAGIRKTAWLTRAIVAVVLVALALVVLACVFGGAADPARLSGSLPGAYGVLQAAGLLFFAFAGYARIATLGEEVADPARTIPRAIPIALGITLAIYAMVAVAALAVLGPAVLAMTPAPLAAAVEAGRLHWLSPIVRIGAAVASLGVLLSLIAGVSRTAFAMAAQRELPSWLNAVHTRYRTPYRAELAAAGLVTALVLVTDLRAAIGFSAFTVLTYYAIANAAALTLRADERRWPRVLAAAGLAGCLLLAFSLPPAAAIAGAAVVATGACAFGLRS